MIIRLRMRPELAIYLLPGLVQVNIAQICDRLARGEAVPSVIGGIQQGRIRYERSDPMEHWQTFDDLVESGRGDCEDLSAAVAAELLVLWGVSAEAIAYRSGPKTHHVIVRSELGLFDPSREAGMGS